MRRLRFATRCAREEIPADFEIEERFADRSVTLEELLADDPERRWHWGDPWTLVSHVVRYGDWRPEHAGFWRLSCQVFRDIFGNPFRPAAFAPSWRTSTAAALAAGMYESRDFGAMPILADALQDAGCDSDDILNHCRGPGLHVRGCWVVDAVLNKE
jgi:hypothetical protein